MKYILSICAISLCTIAGPVEAQSVDVRGVSSVNCGTSTYCLTIQVRAADTTTVQLGTSSIFYRYDTSALSFASFTPLAFDGSDLCDGGNAAWDAPAYDAGKPGVFSIALILKDSAPATSCPVIDDVTWVDVADVCFSIVNSDLHTAEIFDPQYTHFNFNVPDDGTAVYETGDISLMPATCGADADSDGIPDLVDNCVNSFNPIQSDLDNDGIGDSCDAVCNMPITTSGDFVLCEGTTVSLTALSTSGSAPYTYNWSTGESTSSISVTPVGLEQYNVTITDANNCIGVDSMELEVSVSDFVALIIYDLDTQTAYDTLKPNDQYFVSDLPNSWNIEAIVTGDVESVGFEVTGQEFDTDIENWPPYRYPSDNNPAGFEPGFYTLSAAIFSENWEEGVSCEELVIPFEIVDDCAGVELIPHTHICQGEEFTLYAYVAGSHGTPTIAWSTGDFGEEITVAPNLDTDYYVTITDQSNCYFVGEVDIDVEYNAVDELIIHDVALDTTFDTIHVGEVFILDSMPDHYTLEALVSGSHSSVLWYASGGIEDDHLENSEPYRFYGDNADLDLPPGAYGFAAYPYRYNWAEGWSCQEKEVTFHIIQDSLTCKYVRKTTDFGYGSLPYAINCAAPGDTIYFTDEIQGDTIEFDNFYGDIDKDLHIVALTGQEIYVRGNAVPRVFEISNASQVTIRGLKLIAGSAVAGAAIENNGTLTLHDVHIYNRQTSPEDIVNNNGSLNVKGTTQVFNLPPGGQ